MASAAVEPRRDASKRRQDDSPPRSPPPKERRKEDDAVPEADSRRAKNAEALLGRTGGVYIPPAKLAAMRREIKDKSSEEYQKLTWEALKKSLNGLINKVNVSNIRNIIAEIFEENLVRGRGLLCRAVMKAQAASPSFTHVYAALISIINTKLPEIGELLLKRVITQFKKSYRRNDKGACVASVRFMAHLVNQMVAGDILALQLLTLLLEKPTDDSVEIAVGFVQECGKHLSETSPKPFNEIFDRCRSILHEGAIDKRVQFMIEKLFATRKSKFEEFPDRLSELDLVEDTDQITHEDLSLDEDYEVEERLDYFKVDPQFTENEAKYDAIKKEILGKDDDDAVSEDEAAPEGEEGVAAAGGTVIEPAKQTILDETETDKINLRKTIYLTIMSSVDFEECAHKMLKIQFRPGQEPEFCNMTVECCAQERTYMRFYGLLAQRFCMLNPIFQEVYIRTFAEQYGTVHRLDTNKIRNVAKFFAHLLHTDAIPWQALECVHLNEAETTSSSRIFIKILFQELSEFLGIAKLNMRLKDPTLQDGFRGVMPRDNPKNTRFSINFFTSIGLGGLTDDLREWLKNAPKVPVPQDDSSSSASSSSSSSSSSSDSSSSDSEDRKPRKR